MASRRGVPFTLHRSAPEDAPQLSLQMAHLPVFGAASACRLPARPGQTGHLVNKELGLAYVPHVKKG